MSPPASPILLPLLLGLCACSGLPTQSPAPAVRLTGQEELEPTEPESQESQPEDEGWSFVILPYLWVPTADGTGETDSTGSLDIDIFGGLNAALPLAFEFYSPERKFTVLLEALYVGMEDDEGSLRTETDLLMIEGGLGLALDNRRLWSVIAGARFVDLDYEASLLGTTGDASADWVDPWIGTLGTIPMTERWSARFRGDIGGFGVGTEFTWQAMANVGFKPREWISIWGGYRALGQEGTATWKT